MAGRGPAPKPADQRARRNKDPIPTRVVELRRAAQPDLPTILVEESGELAEFVWPARTLEWWRMWAESPLMADATAGDWEFLLDTALLHARYWAGDLKLAGELRQRVAKFGITPEDRARLRIQFAAADEADDRRGTRQTAARDRYAGLKLA